MLKLLPLMLVLIGCTFVSSFDSTTITPLTPVTTRIIARIAGTLTVASTEKITDLAGKDLSTCKIVDTFKGTNHGVICTNIKVDFTIDVESTGVVAARVTN